MTARRTLVRAALASPALLMHGLSRSATRARVGLSLPVSGVQAPVAAELLAGYQLAAKRAATQGVEIELLIEDDRSEPQRTQAAVERFGRDGGIAAASGVVGTPHAKRAIPAARTAGLPLVGIRSGAGELRDGGSFVYHLRASYEAELSLLLRTLSSIHTRITILASDDAFGRAAASHALQQARGLGLTVGAVHLAERNGSDVARVAERAVASDARATALLVLMITGPAIQAVGTARERSFLGAVCTMSFTAGNELAKSGPSVYRGLGLVTAFPVPRSAHDRVSGDFRSAALQASRPDLVESITAAEGFWYGTAIARAVGQAPGAGRAGMVAVLEASKGLTLGDEHLHFDGARVGRHYLRVAHFDREGLLRT
jgi:ABC-type branched-subunit amino acid transport system substrate-binding protein